METVLIVVVMYLLVFAFTRKYYLKKGYGIGRFEVRNNINDSFDNGDLKYLQEEQMEALYEAINSRDFKDASIGYTFDEAFWKSFAKKVKKTENI